MDNTARDGMQDVNTAIQDVLSGYETLKERGEAAIMGIATEMEELHKRHAGEIQHSLIKQGQDVDADPSLRGAVNKIAVTVRDWVGSLDSDAMSFVRQGEEMLLAVYEGALKGWKEGSDPIDRQKIETQAAEIRTRIAALPTS